MEPSACPRPSGVLRNAATPLALLAALTLAVTPAHAFDHQKTKKTPQMQQVQQNLLKQGFSTAELEVTPSLSTHEGREAATAAARAATPEAASVNTAVSAFMAASSPEWEIRWDARNNRPHLLQGAGFALLPGAGNRLTRADVPGANRKLDLPDVERLVRAFMGRYPELLRVDPGTLKIDPTRSTNVDNGRVFFIELQQFYKGVPVEGANVFFRINNGNIVQLGADRVADIRAMRMVPRSDRMPVFKILLGKLGIPMANVTDVLDAGTLKIYPTLTAGEKRAEAFRGTAGEGYAHRLVWEYVFRQKGDNATYKAVVDAHSKALLQILDLTQYATVKGGVYPTTNTDTEVVVNIPFNNVTNGTVKTTDANGNYTFAAGTATSTLGGKYFTMSDACGSISLSDSSTGNLNFGTSAGTDCVTPGVGGAGNTHASRSGFYHLTNINRKAKGFLSTNTWLDSNVTANMNINQTCNAFWNGSTLNFYRSGGGCSNTGELAAVFLHEYGHGIDTNTGGAASESGSGEAVGDTFAFLETKDSCIGQNFQPGVNCANCTNCSGVRDVADFGLAGPATMAKPANVASDTGINCDRYACPYLANGISPYQGPMGYEGHCESYIASGANWDLAQSLVSTYGSTAGWAAMDSIWYKSLVPSKSAYQVASGGKCNPAAVVNGCAATNWYTVYLTADDDDGNLANGTPNACRIWDAFNAHGIACGTRPVCAGGCSPQAVANAGPDQTIAPGGSVTIGTAAVAGTTYSWSPGGATTAQITVSPASTTTYTLTATTTCGSSTDTVVVSVQSGSVAVYDATLKAPKCSAVGSACDSGPSLLVGRSTKGPEPNQPNTVAASVCADGTSGTFHSDESNDALKIETVDGTPLAAGKSVKVTATVWAYSTPTSDFLDLYSAPNANSPVWTLIGTVQPTAAGQQALSKTFTLPAGALQAVRANFRYTGAAAACSTGAYDDHDDLVFAVGAGAGDTQAPTTSITAPANGATVSGTVSVTATASDNVGVTATEIWIDGARVATSSSYSWNTTTATNATHTIFSKAFDAAGNVGTSATISVTVNNVTGGGAQTAVYDATSKAPKCAAVGSSCDSSTLLNGRSTLGPESNAPNTIASACTDGTSGTFHSDESNDKLKIAATSGNLTHGASATVTATVWAWSTTADTLDLYYAANASSPTWTLIGSFKPSATGATNITATYTLPGTTAGTQAIRANFRYNGAASSCSTGAYDDHDDLVFAVN
jgi:hypothetical protein